MKKNLINRKTYKAIKKYDHQQMEEFCTRIYINGYKDGIKEGINLEDIETAIDEVKGIGPIKKARLIQEIKKMRGGI